MDTTPAPQPNVEVKPLLCPSCGGAVPLADGDSARCPYCSASVPIPESYREIRDANRIDEADRASVEAAFAHLGRPPGALLQLSANVARAGWRLWFIFLLPGVLLPFALDVFWFGPIAPSWGFSLPDVLGPYWYALAVIGGFELVFIIPLIVIRYRGAQAFSRSTLSANMAARPPARPGGPAECRQCGSSLAVPKGALGVRCAYCGADNLVALPPEWVARFASSSEVRHARIQSALHVEANLLPAARRATWISAVWTALLLAVATVCWGSWLQRVSPGNWRQAISRSPRSVRIGDKTFEVGVGGSGDSQVVESDPNYCLGFEVPLHEGEQLSIVSPQFSSHQELAVVGSDDEIIGRSSFRHDPQTNAMVAEFVAPYSGWFGFAPHGDWATEPEPPPTLLHLRISIAPADSGHR